MALSSMAFTAVLSQSSFSCLSRFPPTSRRNPLRLQSIRAVKAAEPGEEKTTQTKSEEESSSNAQPSTKPSKLPKKPVYSSEFWNFMTIFYLFWKWKRTKMLILIFLAIVLRFSSLGTVKKGQIVRVDKEKYLNSVNVSISWPFLLKKCFYFFLYLQINPPKKKKNLVLVLVQRRFLSIRQLFATIFCTEHVCL